MRLLPTSSPAVFKIISPWGGEHGTPGTNLPQALPTRLRPFSKRRTHRRCLASFSRAETEGLIFTIWGKTRINTMKMIFLNGYKDGMSDYNLSSFWPKKCWSGSIPLWIVIIIIFNEWIKTTQSRFTSCLDKVSELSQPPLFMSVLHLQIIAVFWKYGYFLKILTYISKWKCFHIMKCSTSMSWCFVALTVLFLRLGTGY